MNARLLRLIPALLLLSLLLTYGGYRLLLLAPMSQIDRRPFTPAQLAAFRQDLEAVRAAPLFPPPPPQTSDQPGVQIDAAPVLGRYITGEGNAAPEPPMERSWWNGPDRMPQRLKDGWLNDPASMPTGDFSLLEELQPFQWWEADAYGAYARMLAADPRAGYDRMPVADYRPLTDLAAARLADGLRRPDQLLSALQQTRHLAALVYSDETLISTMSALGMATMERKAAAEGVRLGHLIGTPDGMVLRAPAQAPAGDPAGDPAGVTPSLLSAINNWMPPTEAQIEAHKRLANAWLAVLQQPDASLPPDSTPFGFCAALGETVLVSGMIRTHQLHAWPLEEDFAAQTAVVALGLEIPGCRIPTERRRWEEGTESVLSGVPYYRSVQAAVLLNLARPDYNPYD